MTGFDDLFARADEVLETHRRNYPGAPPSTQPVHTVYVPGDRMTSGPVSRLGDEAARLLERHVADAAVLARVFELDSDVAQSVLPRLQAKLGAQPVEDVRVDFEDGYGMRSDGDEDADAASGAAALAAVLATDGAPSRAGLRIKSFADGHHRRAIATLRIFLDTFLDAVGELPDGFRITFPKVVAREHVRLFADALARLETELGLAHGDLGFEVQVETPQAILDTHGRVPLLDFVHAADGRLQAAHFGVFDYTAALGLPATQQRLDHPACDAARDVMQVALAGTGVELSDGSSNITPASDQTPAVHAAWRQHAATVRHSLSNGYWQGWDMHAAHLVSRFAVVYGFHLTYLDGYLARLAAWANNAPGPSGVMDEPATVRVLATQVRRALACGATDSIPPDVSTWLGNN